MLGGAGRCCVSLYSGTVEEMKEKVRTRSIAPAHRWRTSGRSAG